MEVTAHGMRLRDHGPNVLNSFSEMRNAGILTDVTVYCRGRAIPCHKVVLAATSLRLRGLLTALGPRPCSTIVLNDFDPDMLTLVVDFMYTGEVNCTFAVFQRFLNAALRLGVMEPSVGEEAIGLFLNQDDPDAVEDEEVDVMDPDFMNLDDLIEEEIVEEEEEAGEQGNEEEAGEQGDDGIETGNELDIEASCFLSLLWPVGTIEVCSPKSAITISYPST